MNKYWKFLKHLHTSIVLLAINWLTLDSYRASAVLCGVWTKEIDIRGPICMYCLGPVLVTPPVHVTQGSSSPLQSISAILFATYISYILPSYSLWNLRLSWMFLLKILLFQESIWCKFRSFEFFCTLFKYFWNQVAYMAPWELDLYTYMLIFDHNMQKEWKYEVKDLLEKSFFVVSPVSILVGRGMCPK